MEALVAVLMLSLLVVFVTALIALFRPLPQFWLPERGRAAIVAAVAFILYGRWPALSLLFLKHQLNTDSNRKEEISRSQKNKPRQHPPKKPE